MSRCGCRGSTTCACSLAEGDNVTISGTGSAEDPYVIGGSGGADTGWYLAATAALPADPTIQNSGGSSALTAVIGETHFLAKAGRWLTMFEVTIDPTNDDLATPGQVINLKFTVGDDTISNEGAAVQLIRSGRAGGDIANAFCSIETVDLAVDTVCNLTPGSALLIANDLLTGDPIDVSGWSFSYFCNYIRTDL